MQALKLFQHNEIEVPYKLGEEISQGADGQVFEIKNNPTQVIKLCVLFDRWKEDLISVHVKIKDVLNFIINHCPGICARVFTYEYKSQYSRSTVNGEQDYLLYYYVMEKLNKLSEDEKKVFHSVLSHEDANKIKNYSQEELKQILKNLQRGLEFDLKKVVVFCDELNQLQLTHNDLHPRNIMKDDYNNFKLIDFDRCQLKRKENNE